MVCMHTTQPINLCQQPTTKKPSLLREGPVCGGGDEWNRTIDTRIFSPLLYQLSYITATLVLNVGTKVDVKGMQRKPLRIKKVLPMNNPIAFELTLSRLTR